MKILDRFLAWINGKLSKTPERCSACGGEIAENHCLVLGTLRFCCDSCVPAKWRQPWA